MNWFNTQIDPYSLDMCLEIEADGFNMSSSLTTIQTDKRRGKIKPQQTIANRKWLKQPYHKDNRGHTHTHQAIILQNFQNLYKPF